LAISGSAIVTSHLHYNPTNDNSGYHLVNPYDFPCYYELNWYVRDTWLTEVRSSNPVYRSSHIVTLDGSEWKHSKITGYLPAKNPKKNWFKLDFVLNSGILAYNQVRWSLYTARTPAIEGNVQAGPTKFPGEIATVDPWLGHTVGGKRDDEEVEDETVVEVVETVPDDTPTETAPTTEPDPPAPVYVGPSSGTYRVYTSLGGDGYYYSLYHELLNRYTYRTGSAWVLNSPSQGNGASMYAETSNGNGWLDLSRSQPSWDSGSWHPVYFTSVGNGRWAVGDGAGRYLAWGNTPSVGQYAGASASFALAFTTDIAASLAFDFYVV